MRKYIAQIRMINDVQVEFELPDGSDQSIIEIQAAIEAKSEWGDADHIECVEYEDVT